MIDDGVIKYSLQFIENRQGIAKQAVQCSEIEAVRERLFSLGLIGAYENGTNAAIGYGNISVRVNNSESFVITGTQTGELPALTTQHYALVQEVNFNTFTVTASGAIKPSAEAITHACIYQLESEVNAVIHVHSEALWDFMLKNDYLSTNDTPYGTLEMVEDIKGIYNDIDALSNSAFVMKGHFEGVVVFGANIKQAENQLYSVINDLLKNKSL